VLESLDHTTLRAFYGYDYPGKLSALMVALTVVGGGWSLLGLVPFVLAKRTRRMGAAFLATVFASDVVGFLIKLVVRRTRPYLTLGLRPLWGRPTDFSFPSGHATGSFAAAAFIATLLTLRYPRRPAAIVITSLVVLSAFAVSASRVYLGVHYPSDVLAGAALGAVVGGIGALTYERRWGDGLRHTSSDASRM
jgi:undecaprenyl-diphosphatase